MLYMTQVVVQIQVYMYVYVCTGGRGQITHKLKWHYRYTRKATEIINHTTQTVPCVSLDSTCSTSNIIEVLVMAILEVLYNIYRET